MGEKEATALSASRKCGSLLLDLLEHLRKEWAVISGAPISLVIVAIICFLIVSTLYRQRFALLKDELADYRYALEAVAPAQSANRIRIKGPSEGERVSREFLVRGSAKPVGSAVQVLILARDGFWYPQERPNFSGTGWSARCWAGEETAPSGAEFRLVAIDGTNPISGPVNQIPSGVARSKTVTIYRA